MQAFTYSRIITAFVLSSAKIRASFKPRQSSFPPPPHLPLRARAPHHTRHCCSQHHALARCSSSSLSATLVLTINTSIPRTSGGFRHGVRADRLLRSRSLRIPFSWNVPYRKIVIYSSATALTLGRHYSHLSFIILPALIPFEHQMRSL